MIYKRTIQPNSARFSELGYIEGKYDSFLDFLFACADTIKRYKEMKAKLDDMPLQDAEEALLLAVSEKEAKSLIHDYLLDYSGNFNFVSNTALKLKAGKRLSPNVYVGILKCLLWDRHKWLDSQNPKKEEKPLIPHCGLIVMVNKGSAIQINNKLGMSAPNRLWEIVQVKKISRKGAILVRAKLASAKDNGIFNCCRNCGKDLTDARSIATGMGAICAGHFGIPYPKVINDAVVKQFYADLQLEIDKIGVVQFWLPPWGITHGKEVFNDLIARASRGELTEEEMTDLYGEEAVETVAVDPVFQAFKRKHSWMF